MGKIRKSGRRCDRRPAVIGNDCEIKNCVIESGVIGNECVVGEFSVVKRSVIMDKSNIPHLNYVADSVIAENCNLGAGTKIANLRFDNANVKVTIKGKRVDSGRRKLGAIIGYNVKTGINVSIYPGVKMAATAGSTLELLLRGMLRTKASSGSKLTSECRNSLSFRNTRAMTKPTTSKMKVVENEGEYLETSSAIYSWKLEYSPAGKSPNRGQNRVSGTFHISSSIKWRKDAKDKNRNFLYFRPIRRRTKMNKRVCPKILPLLRDSRSIPSGLSIISGSKDPTIISP